MEDLIRRSDAIEAIKDNSFALGDDYMEINGYGAIDDIRALPSADRPQGEWIPCSERLPRWDEHVNEMVLVCYGNGSVRFNTFMNGQWCQGNPLAWMPIPDPWKGADDE